MLPSPGLLFTIVSFLLVIGPLVFVHELGHYLVARWCGIGAETFSIGFGREMVGWTDRRGTRWKVGWLPLGGYVKFAGDMNAAGLPSDDWLMLPAEERARTFQAKPVWQRFLVVAAGPATNFLFAVVAFMVLLASFGEPTSPPVINSVEPGTPAASAGLRPGDRILSIDATPIDDFDDVYKYVVIRPNQRLQLEIERDRQHLLIPVRTVGQMRPDAFGNKPRTGLLGVKSGTLEVTKVPLAQLPQKAVKQTVGALKMIVVTMKQLILGERSVHELGGPLKVAQISGQQASLGWMALLNLMAFISINLGFINLLPVPMLDGGHLLFYVIEGVRRRPLKAKSQEWAFRAGLAALLMLMLMVTFNDLASFGLWSRLGGLIG
jgi:regulator of sigma E protease